MGVGSSFSFPLPTPHGKCLHYYQTPVIIVFVAIAAVVVVTMALITLVTLSTLFTLNLDLTSPQIAIYIPHPMPHDFNLNLDYFPTLDLDFRLDCPQLPPLLRFYDGLILLPGALILLGRPWVWVRV